MAVIYNLPEKYVWNAIYSSLNERMNDGNVNRGVMYGLIIFCCISEHIFPSLYPHTHFRAKTFLPLSFCVTIVTQMYTGTSWSK